MIETLSREGSTVAVLPSFAPYIARNDRFAIVGETYITTFVARWLKAPATAAPVMSPI